MVVIRLSRVGSKNKPKYQVRVSDSRKAPQGRFIERLGYFDPKQAEKTVINKEKYLAWINKGAKPSQRVKSLFNKVNQQKEQ